MPSIRILGTFYMIWVTLFSLRRHDLGRHKYILSDAGAFTQGPAKTDGKWNGQSIAHAVERMI